MLAFANVKGESDWKRGKQAPATWRPLTDWKSCDVVDPSHLDPSAFRMDALEEEVQKEREKAALQAKARSKLQTLSPAGQDPRDGGGG
jgi:hypothetical protein